MELKLKPGEHINVKLKSSKIYIIPNIMSSITLFPSQYLIEINKGKIRQLHKTKQPITFKLDPFSKYIIVNNEKELSKILKKFNKKNKDKLLWLLKKKWWDNGYDKKNS